MDETTFQESISNDISWKEYVIADNIHLQLNSFIVGICMSMWMALGLTQSESCFATSCVYHFENPLLSLSLNGS